VAFLIDANVEVHRHDIFISVLVTRNVKDIDGRLRHRQDYSSAGDIVRGLSEENIEEVTSRTVQRDIEKMRDRATTVTTIPT